MFADATAYGFEDTEHRNGDLELNKWYANGYHEYTDKVTQQAQGRWIAVDFGDLQFGRYRQGKWHGPIVILDC